MLVKRTAFCATFADCVALVLNDTLERAALAGSEEAAQLPQPGENICGPDKHVKCGG